jgi:hypothetical protein
MNASIRPWDDSTTHGANASSSAAGLRTAQLKCALIGSLLIVLSSFIQAQNLEFSIEGPSPQMWSAADILLSAGSGVRFPSAALGLLTSDDVDSFSYGDDEIEPLGPYNFVRIAYSVAAGAQGNGGVIASQAQGNGVAGDKLQASFVGYQGMFFPVTAPQLLSDAPLHQLHPLPMETELDSLSLRKPGAAEFPVYFCVRPGQGFGAGDILMVVSNGAAPQLFASAAQLGLVPGDDIDALAIGTMPVGSPRPLSLGSGVVVWVSLRAGSPTRGTVGLGGSDGIIQVYPGSPTVVVDAPILGLAPGDELDAITGLDPGIHLYASLLPFVANIGGNKVGSVTRNGSSSFTVVGGGNDIWDGRDEFTFAYAPVTGDFDVQVRVDSLAGPANWSKAGLMVRESLSEFARMIFPRVTPVAGANDTRFSYRNGIEDVNGIAPYLGFDNGGAHEDCTACATQRPGNGHTWLRLVRAGNVFTASSSANGTSWTTLGVQNTAGWGGGALPTTLYLGLGVSRHSGGPTATAEFRDFRFNYTVPFAVAGVSSRGNPNGVYIAFNRPPGAGAFDPGRYQVIGPSGPLSVSRVSWSGRNELRLDVAVPAGGLIQAAGGNPNPALEEGAGYIVSLNGVPGGDGTQVTFNGTFVHGAGYEARGIHITHNKTSDGQYFVNSDGANKGFGDPIRLGGGTFPAVGSHTLFEDPVPDSPNNERFSSKIWGVLCPTTSGDYRFACNSDDVSRLYLSTDDDPANKVQIAFEPQWNNSRQYAAPDRRNPSAPENQSGPIPLEAGKKYYLELVFTEGGGGNNASATWQPPGGPAIVNGSSPIPESAFVPSRSLNGTVFHTLGPVSVTKNPADTTVPSPAPVTFSVRADGTPDYSYQWQCKRANDSQFSDIPGGTSSRYTVESTTPADNQKQFRCIVRNEFSETTSAAATLTVTSDTMPPTLVSAINVAGSDTQFDLVFSEAVNETDAETLANYSISGGVTLQSAELQADRRTVRFTATSLTEFTRKEITVNGVRDASDQNNLIAPDSRIALVYSTRDVLVHRFDGIGGVAVEDLENHSKFPNQPDFIGEVNQFEFRQDSPGDYGVRLMAFLSPPVTGNYTFYVAGDDHAAIWLSTDENPANKVQIAKEPIWGSFRQYNGEASGGGRGSPPANISVPVHLEGGDRYYIEAIVKQAGGGGYVSVAWQTPPDGPQPNVPENGSAPIPADYVSALNLFPSITTQPGNLVVLEGRKATFTFSHLGTPPYNYQWFRNDGNGAAPIPGATGPSYTIESVTLGDNNATFSVNLSQASPPGQITSDSATLTVTKDTAAPQIERVVALSPNKLLVAFDEPLDLISAQTPGNYSVSGVNVTSATQRSGTEVLLELSGDVTLGSWHDLSATGIIDIFGNIAANQRFCFRSKANSATRDAIRNSNPIGYWSFDDVIGSGVNNWGDLEDTADGTFMTGLDSMNSVPTEFNAGFGPGPEDDLFGFSSDNPSALFDGDSGNFWMDTGGSHVNNLEAFTVNAWVKPPGTRPSSEWGAGCAIAGQRGVIEFGFGGSDFLFLCTGNGGCVTAPFTDTRGDWFQVTGVGDGQALKIYVNGILAGDGGFPTANYGASLNHFQIGGGGILFPGDSFIGKMDEVAVWDRALPGDEIGGFHRTAMDGIGAATLPPTILPIPDVTGSAGQAITFDAFVNDLDTPLDQLKFAASSGNTALIPNENISITGNGPFRQVTLTPAANQSGTTTIRIHVFDGENSTYEDVLVTVVSAPTPPPNTPPTFVVGENQTVFEDSGPQTVPGLVTGIQPHDNTPWIFTSDFTSGTGISFLDPNGAGNNPDPRIGDGVLKLTDANDPGGFGGAAICLPGAQSFSGLDARWRTWLGGGTGPAGLSFNLGTDLAENFPGDEGTGTGLSVAIDTFDNGMGDDPGLKVKWRGNSRASLDVPAEDDGSGNFLRKDRFVDTSFVVNPNGQVTFSYDGNTITANLAGYTGLIADQFNFGAEVRTGGDNQWIDDLHVTLTPVDTSAAEAGQTVKFNVSNDNPSLFSVQPAVSADGTLTYTPTPNANGVAIVTVVAMDDGGRANGGRDMSASQTFTITVNAVNDPPTLEIPQPQAGEDILSVKVHQGSGRHEIPDFASANPGPENEQDQTIVRYILTGGDIPNPEDWVTPPTITPDGTLIFEAKAHYWGPFLVRVVAQDSGGGGVAESLSAPKLFKIDIQHVNQPPGFTKGANHTTAEDAGPQTVAGWASGISAGTDDAGQQVQFLVTSDNESLFSTAPAVSPNGTLTYTTALNAHGTATVTVVAEDNGGTENGGINRSAPQTFTITVTPVNDAPAFASGADRTAQQDAGAQVVPAWATDISAGPPDEAGQNLVFQVSNDNNPLFADQPDVSPDGTLTFTPAAGASGVATVTVKLMDNGGTDNGGVNMSPPQIFTITIEATSPPSLTIAPLPNQVGYEIRWKDAEGNFYLEATPSLNPPQWRLVNEGVMKEGDERSYRVSLSESIGFFRLRGNEILASDVQRAVEAVISRLGVAPGARILVRGPVPSGTAIIENSEVTPRPVSLQVPDNEGSYYVVIIDPTPGLKFSHPMVYVWIDLTTMEAAHVEAQWPADILAPREVPLPFQRLKTAVIDDTEVHQVTGSGAGRVNVPIGPPDGPVTGSSVSCKKVALVVDLGDEDAFADGQTKWVGFDLADNMAADADAFGDWLAGNGFQVTRRSQYWKNPNPGFDWRSDKPMVDAFLERIEQIGNDCFVCEPDPGCCHEFFLYLNSHGGAAGLNFHDREGSPDDEFLRYDQLFPKLAAFPPCVKIIVFIDACYAGAVMNRYLATLCENRPCGATIVTTVDGFHQSQGGQFLQPDSGTQDFLELKAGLDWDNDGKRGDFRDRWLMMRLEGGRFVPEPAMCPGQTSMCSTD